MTIKKDTIIAIIISLVILISIVVCVYYISDRDAQTAREEIVKAEVESSLFSEKVVQDIADVVSDNYTIQEVHLGDKNGLPIGYVQIYDDGKVVAKAYDFDLLSKISVAYNPRTRKFEANAATSYKLKEKPVVTGDDWEDKEFPLQTKVTVEISKYLKPTQKFIDFGVNPLFSVNYGYVTDNSFGLSVGLGASLLNMGTSCFQKIENIGPCNSDFKILGVTANVDIVRSDKKFVDRVGVQVHPIMVNTRKLKIPGFYNLYLSPSVGSQGNDMRFGIGLNFSL